MTVSCFIVIRQSYPVDNSIYQLRCSRPFSTSGTGMHRLQRVIDFLADSLEKKRFHWYITAGLLAGWTVFVILPIVNAQNAFNAKTLPKATFLNIVLYSVHLPFFHDSYPKVVLWRRYYLAPDGWLLTLVLANMLLVAALRLRKIFKNNKERLWAYYILQVIGLGFLALFYLPHFFIGNVMGLLAPWIFWRKYLGSEGNNDKHLRGAKLVSITKVRHYYSGQLTPENPGFLWGGVRIPEREATTHFLVAGASGSGKTLTLRFLMQDMLPRITDGSGKRAIIYDAARDVLPLLAGMDLKTEVCILNPFDDRCYAWDIAADINSIATVESLVDILVPPGEKEDEFFRSAAIGLLQLVMEFFIIQAPGAWTLRDVVIVLNSLELVMSLLGIDPAMAERLRGLLGTEKTADNILSTVATKIGKYRTIAALWHKAERKISLQQWAQSSSILVLGKDNQANVTLSTLNRLIFTRAAQILLDGDEVKDPRTFVVLDELASLGKLEKLEDFALEGRRRGVCLVVGFQSVESLRRIYGHEMSASIVGQFRHKAILRLDEPPTAEWAAQLIGEQQLDRKTKGYQSEGGEVFGYNEVMGRSQQIIIERTVFPAEFLNIPPVDPDHNQGLTGYYLTRFNHKYTYPLKFLTENLQPQNETHAKFVPTPAHYQRLIPWDEEDWQRLNITTLMLRLEQQREAKQRDEQRIKPATNAGDLPASKPAAIPEIDWNAFLAADTPPPPNGTSRPGSTKRDKDQGQNRR